MINVNLKNLKDKIEQINVGILKIQSPLLPFSQSIIIETCKVDGDGYIWCTSSHTLPSNYLGGKNVGVTLKYIQKSEGKFIKITGRAKLISISQRVIGSSSEKTLNKEYEKVFLLKIEIEEVHSYKKKTISAYTSFLQAINSYTFQLVPGTKL